MRASDRSWVVPAEIVLSPSGGLTYGEAERAAMEWAKRAVDEDAAVRELLVDGLLGTDDDLRGRFWKALAIVAPDLADVKDEDELFEAEGRRFLRQLVGSSPAGLSSRRDSPMEAPPAGE